LGQVLKIGAAELVTIVEYQQTMGAIHTFQPPTLDYTWLQVAR
jgi:hypothetical protein